MSRIIKSGQTVYQDLEVAVYGETFESAEEEDGPAAQEESYTLISEEKRHILEHARNQPGNPWRRSFRMLTHREIK